MGFYLRQSVKVGPLRFNLSKSGIGVSAGVRGLRFGTGPRGNYVHMGRYGLYYRKTFPSANQLSSPRSDVPQLQNPPIPSNTHEPLQEIESADASQMVDSSSAELLAELNATRKKMRLWPLVTILGTGSLLATWQAQAPIWALALLGVVVAVGIFFAVRRDQLAKTVVLFYDFDPEIEKAYQTLHDRASQLAQCAKVWHVEAQGRVHDRKYHAGASSLVRRKPTTIKQAAPPYVKTNISTIAIEVGRQTLHFFPDRILVYASNAVGAVSYQDLQIVSQHSRFIEDESVPSDAKIVDHTWQYVNKNGGPDKRFKNNRRLPMCLYDEIDLSSSNGLNERIQLSRCEVAEGFVNVVQSLGKTMPIETASQRAT